MGCELERAPLGTLVLNPWGMLQMGVQEGRDGGGGKGDGARLGSEEATSPWLHLYPPDETWAQSLQLPSIPVQAAPLLHILEVALGAGDPQGWWLQQGPAHDRGQLCKAALEIR